MPRFDLDAQRGLVCLFGLLGLLGEAAAFYLSGKILPDILTGAFLTMAIGPVATSTVERYRQSKGDRDDPPSPPPEQPSPREEEEREERFHNRHGYYELRPA